LYYSFPIHAPQPQLVEAWTLECLDGGAPALDRMKKQKGRTPVCFLVARASSSRKPIRSDVAFWHCKSKRPIPVAHSIDTGKVDAGCAVLPVIAADAINIKRLLLLKKKTFALCSITIYLLETFEWLRPLMWSRHWIVCRLQNGVVLFSYSE
jgi:hypothetical protein